MSALELAVLAAVDDMEEELELSRADIGLSSPSASEDNEPLDQPAVQVATCSEFVGDTAQSVLLKSPENQRSSCNGAHGGVMPSLPCLLSVRACRALQVL